MERSEATLHTRADGLGEAPVLEQWQLRTYAMTHGLLALSWRFCPLDIVNRLRVGMTTKFTGYAVGEAVVHCRPEAQLLLGRSE